MRFLSAWLSILLACPLSIPCLCGEEFTLPPLPVDPARDHQLSSQLTVHVREFRFEGNTVFSDEQLGTVVRPYLDRTLTSEDLEDARRALTDHYVNAGYINSGATLEDQDIADGVLVFTILEGRLTSVNLTGNRWIRDSFVKNRVKIHTGPVLNIKQLQEGLQIIRENPNISRINAELRPGVERGASVLDIRVKDTHPFRVGLEFSNDRPPSIGAEELSLKAADLNLTGNGDVLEITYGIIHRVDNGVEFSGDDNFAGSYTLPFTPYDTTIRIHGEKSDDAVIEEPFDELDIASETIRYGVTLRQPVYRTPDREFALAVMLERRESESFLLGEPFDVSPGSVKGETDITVLRFIQEWVDRSLVHVLALRSTVSVGIDAFGVTDNGTDRDATFVVWLGQAQYVRRLFNTANQIVLRTDVQWTEDTLFAMEQLTVGGMNTVRGYRENQLVRDRGVISSVEFRLPVWYDKTGYGIVQVAPFFDFGGAWNADGSTPDPETIMSAGLGLLVNPNKHLYARVYWGYGFRDFDQEHTDAQDLGFHFQLTVNAF